MQRYSSLQQTLHWVTVILFLGLLPIAWVTIALPEDTPIFYFWLHIHEAIGLMILAITLFRVASKLSGRSPRVPENIGPLTAMMAHFVYFCLFTMMIVMPISGYLWATGHSYDVVPLNLITFPRIAFGNRFLGDVAAATHRYGQWAVYFLIGMHLAGVSFHIIWKRDGLLNRMLPAQEPDRSIAHVETEAKPIARAGLEPPLATQQPSNR